MNKKFLPLIVPLKSSVPTIKIMSICLSLPSFPFCGKTDDPYPNEHLNRARINYTFNGYFLEHSNYI